MGQLVENAYMEYRKLRAAVMELYIQGSYAEALQLLERAMDHLVEYESQILSWAVSLQAVSGNYGAAVAALAQAVEKGYWYPVETLREDTDLIPLLGQPEFEKLAAVCAERQAAAAARACPEYILLEPHGKESRLHPLLIALHGRNSNAAQLLPYWQMLAIQGWYVALPQSSQVCGHSGFCWDDTGRARHEVETHYNRLLSEFPIDYNRILLGGFSQGAGLMIEMLLSSQLAARGLIAVSPFVRRLEEIAALPEDGIQFNQRAYLVTGDQDEHQEIFQDIERAFQSHHVDYRRESHAGLGHDFPPDFSASLSRALNFILNDNTSSSIQRGY